MQDACKLQRRGFLRLAAAVIATTVTPASLSGQTLPDDPAANNEADARHPEIIVENYFRAILDGFLRNAETTSKNWATCDFPGGTKIKTCCTPAEETYTSVARMMP